MDSDVLAFHSPHGWLEIFCRVIRPEAVRVPGVQHLRFAVGGHGFSGAGDGFVPEDELRAFSNNLLALVGGSGDGSASLRGSPTGGLTLDVSPGPDAGSLSVVGNVAVVRYRTLRESDGIYQWRTDFGFSVHRDAVPNLRLVKWISTYAD